MIADTQHDQSRFGADAIEEAKRSQIEPMLGVPRQHPSNRSRHNQPREQLVRGGGVEVAEMVLHGNRKA